MMKKLSELLKYKNISMHTLTYDWMKLILF